LLKILKWLRWTAVALLLITGIVDLYYGNSYAGFYENLWYVMGGIYVFAAIVIAANIEPHFSQLTVFAYALFLWSLWQPLRSRQALDWMQLHILTRLWKRSWP